ncbi:Flagellar biosynthetic protein FlhB [Phycisphaerae bacterium RAS1]|nr:Flagellar biosynthetic protein FlhB [Phycisphaerae bacterium RAS1]
MAADDAGEKTEQPTARRLQEAREEGRVARSVDLSGAVAILAGIVLLRMLGPGMLDRFFGLTHTLGDAGDPTAGDLGVWLVRSARVAAEILGPFLAGVILITISGTVAQSGLLLSTKKLAPKLDVLNPVNGLKRLVSSDSVVRLGQGLAKMLLVAWVAYVTIRDRFGDVLTCGAIGTDAILMRSAELLYTLMLRLALVMLVLGIVDYFWQRKKLNKSLMMTKQEVRDELKRMEGDPMIRQRRRALQQKLALQRINRDVPRADVVVTNPTEFAVALKYDQATMAAPRVVAKGTDFLAARIRQVAQQSGVPVVQRPPLARALYAAVEVGHEVPAGYYRAVAEVLAYVYRLTGRAAG